jgi:hypothetical protein
MTRRIVTQPADDEGAALILVLGLVVLVSALLGGLLSFITTTVSGRVPLDAARSRHYAADGAVEYAISQVRDMPNHNTVVAPIRPRRPAEDPCGPYNHSLNSVAIRVDCTNALRLVLADGFVVTQRNVIFAACVDTGVACTDATTIIRAQVNFETPESAAGVALPITRTYVQSWSVNG